MSRPGASLLIRGGRILRGDLGCERADMLVEGGRIAAIARPGEIVREGVETLDASDRMLVPGLVNGHTHSHGALGKGAVGDRVPLEVFLSASGAINGARTLDDKRISAALSAVELIRKGCTAFYDLFVELPGPSLEGMAAVADAYRSVGIRAVLAPMISDRTLYQAVPGLLASLPEPWRAEAERIRTAPTEETLASARGILRAWPGDRDLVRPALGPAIPLHCSDAFLQSCARLAAEFDVPIQTHLAESKTQAVVAEARYGVSLVEHLDRLDVLSSRFSAAHGIWLSDGDIRRLADRGAGVVHNPMSNLRLGSGVAPARALLDAGVTLGVGTDASNTSDGQSMFEAMRLAAFLSRIADPAPERWLSAEDAFRAATTGSAAILGFPDIGRLEPGCRADIVFLYLRHINYVPLRWPLLQMVFAENGAAIDRVMIEGRTVLADGEILTVDETALRREAQAASDRLDGANEDDRGKAAELGCLVGCFCLGHARSAFGLHRRLPDPEGTGRRRPAAIEV